MLCALCFLFTFITRFTWPPLISVVVPALGMTMGQAGAFMSAFYLGYLITQIPAGVLADRYGARVILSLSLLIEGTATMTLSLIDSYELGFNLRILAGFGAGAVFASCSRALVEWFPPKEQGLAFGLLMAAPSGGILITNVLVPHLNQSLGWHGAFLAVGSLTFTAGVLILLLMKSNCTYNEKIGDVSEGLRLIFGNRDLMLTAATGFFLMWLQLGTATWANAYIKSLGFSISQAGQVMAWYGLGGVVAPLVSGIMSDRLDCRKPLVLAALVAVIPTTILFGQQTSFSMLCIVGLAAGFMSYIVNPQLTIMISQFAGMKWAATANGVSNFLFQLASLLSPWFIGLVIDSTGIFDYVWWILAMGPVVSILFILGVREKSVIQLGMGCKY
ncbi:putative sulfoacetate transporter SauU [Sporomusa silvacetica DSM 10669]|uniref:Sulfoacetate transporter SauU n=2 Tax=Sporomusa silvacetica TaxID=55504 RepID=A0ABZ3IG71_9FIRM|nr:putative sulfoacetate transporter SauU [Sporomusa silvacetica DSM 10669]